MSGSDATPTPSELPWPLIESPDGTVTVLVSGSRKWVAQNVVNACLESLFAQYPILTVVEGGNPNGADHHAGLWAASARHRGAVWTHMPARWGDYAPHERWHAGHDRNQTMVDVLVAARARNAGVTVVAFKDVLDPRLFGRPASAKGGTEDCIRRAWRCEIPVWHVAVDTPLRLRPTEQTSLPM